jgi:hypothetical protein
MMLWSTKNQSICQGQLILPSTSVKKKLVYRNLLKNV